MKFRKSAQSRKDTRPGGCSEKSTSCFLEKISHVKHLIAVSRLESRKTEQIIFVFPGRPESVATLPPVSPIEGQKWFDQISSQ
jgi:hypothetical protein